MTETKGRRRGAIVMQAVLVCVVLAVAGGIVALVWLFIAGIPEPRAQAQVGDCMVSGQGGRFEKVDCADQSAAFTVVGRVDGRPQTEAADACKVFASPAPERAYWEGQQGAAGTVLCLRGKTAP